MDVERWDLVGPLPERLGPAAPSAGDAWSRLFVERAAARGVTASEPLACVARETARFVAAKGQYPGSLLTDFLVARCGSFAPGVRLNSVSGEVPAEVDDAAVFERWKADATRLADGVATGDVGGMAFVREGGRAALVVASHRPRGALEPRSIFPDADGTVVVRGTAPAGTASVHGYANQGRLKSLPCKDTERYQLPSFELVCRVDPADEHAWVEVLATEKGRLLSSTFGRLLVWPAGQPSSAYTRPAYGVSGGEPTAEGLLARLNEVRTGGGLAPVELSPAQSRENHELAPFFFDAVVRDDAEQQDRIGLGVMAGWRVEQEIAGGTFSAEWVDAPDLSLLLAHQLESASSRAQLLDPDHRLLGVGLYREENFVAALVSAYPKVGRTSWPESTDDVLIHLDEARKKQGKKETQWIRLPSQLEKSLADRVAKRELDDDEALEVFMQEVTDVTRRPVQGWRLHAAKLSSIDWPEGLLKKENLELLAVVTVQRKQDEPWANVVILVVVLLNDNQA